MDNIAFIDEENTPTIHQDQEDYDERCDTSDTSQVETSFIEPDTTEPTSTLRLRQTVK